MISAGKSNTGLVVSSIVNVAVVVLILPQSSVAVNVTKVEPLVPQLPVKSPTKSFVHTIGSLHTSVAVAPPLLFNHACKAVL